MTALHVRIYTVKLPNSVEVTKKAWIILDLSDLLWNEIYFAPFLATEAVSRRSSRSILNLITKIMNDAHIEPGTVTFLQ